MSQFPCPCSWTFILIFFCLILPVFISCVFSSCFLGYLSYSLISVLPVPHPVYLLSYLLFFVLCWHFVLLVWFLLFIKCDLIIHLHQASLNLDYKVKPACNTYVFDTYKIGYDSMLIIFFKSPIFQLCK